jgi:hypothetical protein
LAASQDSLVIFSYIVTWLCSYVVNECGDWQLTKLSNYVTAQATL